MASWIVVLAASAGGGHALRTIVNDLPPDLPAAIVIVQHRTDDSPLEEVLRLNAKMPVHAARDGAVVDTGRIYVARPDAHLTVTRSRQFRHIDGRRRQFVRSSANPLLESVAEEFRRHAIAVVLSGTGRDATDGVQTISEYGGIVIAQDPGTANQSGMPMSAVETGVVDYVLPVAQIAPTLLAIIHGRPVERAS